MNLARLAALNGLQQNARLLGVYDFSGGLAAYRAWLQAWLLAARDGDLLMCHAATEPVQADPIGTARHEDCIALPCRAAVARLLANRGPDLLVVTGLGSPSYDVMAAGDDDRNFYLWGAMGGAAMIGLGLALARPDTPVLVLTGDGEQLMGLGALATVGARAPRNLSIVVLDNRLYGETGMQASHTGRGVDLVAVRVLSCSGSGTDSGVIAGVDWVAVAARAQAQGLPCTTADDLRAALCADGVSTAETVSTVAGRGVGLGALRAACVDLGGRLEIDSRRGAGTTVRCVVPVSPAALARGDA